YRHQLPVQAYVVLELNGPAYQKWLAEAQKDLEIARNKVEREKNDKKKKSRKRDLKEIEIKIAMQSKLFAVDAGQEPGVLRNKYPDRSKYIIAPAAFKIHREKIYSKPLPASKRYFLSGRVDEILVEDIHVPNEFREFFIAEIKSPTIQYLPHDKPTSDLKPRYSVTVNYGKRYEPWIAAVNKLE
nr:DUF4824 family protein [Nitrospinaceae bacterium]NIR56468.1 DUF4824 family protein [Nitrospinaceae bacterium]NIS86929.1 DUF4824 family protein [Nitrospinaceae bacterium]NIT83767.1 DUF4824 family protein [Nitrospinaceae bacterium]NIU45970.1 DUF4824 family protein [Nitrospinaceae bacterium]